MILIVENDKSVREVLGMIMQALGQEFDTADGVNRALQKMSQRTPDILLTDARLFDGDVGTIVRTCQTLHPKTVIVLMSAMNRLKLEELARDLKVERFIEKPFALDSIEQLILTCQNIRRTQNSHLV